MNMRTILHCDINNCFASIEMAINPSLKGLPIAVCGDPKQRRGIVLAKSEAAKRCGVATGDPLWQARQKCPDIRFIEPHFDVYADYSRCIQRYYLTHTPLVEPFGLDECWLDISSRSMDMVRSMQLADQIRLDINRLFDVTISIGVSFNKVFAKLGSDLKKPDAVTCIPASSFRQQIWPLPASQMLGVGRSTSSRLAMMGISTIGQIAMADRQQLIRTFGKNGLSLWIAANGLENTPVKKFGETDPRQSLGHGTTLPQDAQDISQIWPVIESLAEKIAFELQAENLIGYGMQITVRDAALRFHQYQRRFAHPAVSSRRIAEYSLMLLSQHYNWTCAIRAFGIRIYDLTAASQPIQRTWMDYVASLDTSDPEKDSCEAVDSVIRSIQERFGESGVQRGYQLNAFKKQPGFFPSACAHS